MARKKYVMSRTEFDQHFAIYKARGAKDRIGKQSLELIIQGNEGLIKTFGMPYMGKGVPDEDMMQAGRIGLFRAVEKFDPSRGLTFANLAFWQIRAEMQQLLHGMKHTVRLPVGVHRTYQDISHVITRYRVNFKRLPSIGELSKDLDIPEEKIVEALNGITLQPEVGEREEGWGDDIPWRDPEESLDDFAKLKVREIVEAMPASYKGILKMSYGLNASQRSFSTVEMEAILGVAAAEINDRKEQAELYLREMCDRHDLTEVL